MDYLVVKWLHVLSSTALFGTGIGSAFYLLVISLERDPRAIAAVSRWVVRADWLFTATTALFQPLSGGWLAWRAGFPLDAGWLVWSYALYALAIACWLPVVWLQIRLRDLAADSVRSGLPLSARYWRYFRYWLALGFPALFAFLAVFYLMIAKPA